MILGDYRVIKEIGKGAFGRTFYGEHVTLKKPVCLKQNMVKDPKFAKLFKKEAKLLWDIRHSSLPTLKAYYERDDYGHVIAMSFVRGKNLLEIVEEIGPIDDEHVAWIMQRILDALSYLHYHKIVHCDIKPQNIILNTKIHNATLVDFGMYVQNPGGKTRAKGGTEFFIPPEFEQGLPPIPASDIYSLGKTMLYLAGGNPNTGSFPHDMHKEFKEIISFMVRQDSLSRPQDTRGLNREVTKFRMNVYNRTATKEEFKTRR